MPGIDRNTGRAIDGWDHVVQSLTDILTTAFNERLMLWWYGSYVPAMIGKPMHKSNLLRFFYSIIVAIELWEPRFKVIKVDILEANASGDLGFNIIGEYLPNATSGDFQTSFSRTLLLAAKESGIVVNPVTGSL